MLTIYLVVVGVGVLAFLVAFFYEMKKEAGADSSQENISGVPAADDPVFQALTRKRSSESGRKPVESESPSGDSDNASSSSRVELKEMTQTIADKLDQKCIKLEKILEEKNRILDRLQKDLESERSHRGEFESLKGILQQQIDDLKLQNRNLKDELDRVLQDSLRLQAGLPVVNATTNISPIIDPPLKALAQPNPLAADFVRADPDNEIIPAAPEKTLILGGAEDDDSRKERKPLGGNQGQGISLHDIFGGDKGSQQK